MALEATSSALSALGSKADGALKPKPKILMHPIEVHISNVLATSKQYEHNIAMRCSLNAVSIKGDGTWPSF